MIPLFKVFMSKDVLKPLNEVLMSGYIAQGSQTDTYETRLKEYFENDRIITVNAATSGLHLCYRILQNEILKEYDGDEISVLSCPLTCTATNFPIVANGYSIKWVDVDPQTCGMDLDDLKSKLDETTRIVTIVHWGGYPLDLDKLAEIQQYSQKHFGFVPWIVQDCAHAFGAKYKGAFLANHPKLQRNICVYSTQAIKHLTTGDGGFVIFPNDELLKRGKLLRWYGIDRENPGKRRDYRIEQNIAEWGYKFHMNDINATIGTYNLPYINENIKKAGNVAKYYLENINNPTNVKTIKYLDNRECAWWLFTMTVKNKYKFIEYMNSNNIAASQVHKRNDGHSTLAEFKTQLPVLDEFEKELVCIPIGWWINEEQMKYIVDCVNKYDSRE